MVVMLQEVQSESLRNIFEHPWIRLNFVLSDIKAWQCYFTIMMVSKLIDTSAWFRVPLKSIMERDALFVDIPLTSEEGQPTKNRLRLCTVHLESLPEGESLRLHQLAQISKFLRAPETAEGKVIASLVGGDMNTILPSDHGMHKMSEVDLHDVWEDTPPLPIPLRKPFRKDLTYGLAWGNTWGYQACWMKLRIRLESWDVLE
ncbi:hypothetical protein BDD12DRAFT_834952 [Trichophaea hybrida]|nr:hypothetical protein BDD12DRAFT_834952 [Trichophaea hybrida]